MKALVERAQRLTDTDRQPRWVRYTSLGWRIELYPPSKPDELDQLCIPITPKDTTP